MQPVYDRDGMSLYFGDCREILPGLDVGAIVTDPPYGIEHSSNHGASWEGRQILGDGDSALRDWAIAFAADRSLPWAAFGNWKCQRPPGCRGVLIWDKGPAFGMGDLSFPWKMSWEEIYVGGPEWKGVRDEGVLRGHLIVSWESKGRRHQHQKPVSLMVEIIKKLPRDLVIVDPFAGSGSTGVACMKAGRNCILIERDDRCIDIIIRRLQGAETPLFSGAADD